MFAHAENKGLVTVPSNYSVEKTMDRLLAIVAAKEITIFSRINFAVDAAQAGLTMRDAQLLIFGNPKAGTPIIQATPVAAIDLPLKILVWEDVDQKIWATYNALDYLGARHGISSELLKPLAGIASLVSKAVQPD
jgi:uncharacterized protein (DUF302 family)